MASFVNVRALIEKEKDLVDSNQHELPLLEKAFPSQSEGVGPALLGDSIITPPSTCVLRHFKSCPTLCDPMDCSPPGSSVHGILQAIILEWVAISSSRGSSWPRGQTFICLLHWQSSSLPPVPPGKPICHERIKILLMPHPSTHSSPLANCFNSEN